MKQPQKGRDAAEVGSANAVLRGGRLVWHYDSRHDVVTLGYSNLTLENAQDVEWFERECEGFWTRFHGSATPPARKDILVDMQGIVVKPGAAAAWNAARARLAEKYLQKTYRFGGERRTQTAVHLGQALHNTEGTIHANRDEALAALLTDRAASTARRS